MSAIAHLRYDAPCWDVPLNLRSHSPEPLAMPGHLAKTCHCLGRQGSAVVAALLILPLSYQSAPGADEAEAAKVFDALIARYRAQSEPAWAELENVTDAAARRKIY